MQDAIVNSMEIMIQKPKMALSQKQQHKQELSPPGGPGCRRCKDAWDFLNHDMCVGLRVKCWQ